MNSKAFSVVLSLLVSSSVFAAATTGAVDKPTTLKSASPAKRNVAQDASSDAAKSAQCFQAPGTAQNEFIRDFATSLTFTVDQLIAVTTMCKTLENINPGETSRYADQDALVKLRQNYKSEQVSHLYGNCMQVRDCLEDVFDSHPQNAADVIQLQEFSKAMQAERSQRNGKSRKD